MLLDWPHIPAAYCYRCPFHLTYASCGLACADALEVEIQRQGAETIAALIAEPVVGATQGAAVPRPQYWPRVREICDHYGVLLIADEVMTGIGRTGKWFAVDHWQIKPDLLVTAKRASSGYWPLGMVLVRQELCELMHSTGRGLSHGYTYVNDSSGAAVGLAVLRYLLQHDLVAASARMGTYLMEALETLRYLPAVGDVRGLGLMTAVELVGDRATNRPFPRSQQVSERVQAVALHRGVNVYLTRGGADGIDGDAVRVFPPFVITSDEIDEVLAVLSEAIGGATST